MQVCYEPLTGMHRRMFEWVGDGDVFVFVYEPAIHLHVQLVGFSVPELFAVFRPECFTHLCDAQLGYWRLRCLIASRRLYARLIRSGALVFQHCNITLQPVPLRRRYAFASVLIKIWELAYGHFLLRRCRPSYDTSA